MRFFPQHNCMDVQYKISKDDANDSLVMPCQCKTVYSPISGTSLDYNRHTRIMCGKKLINNSPFTFALINIVRNRELVQDDHDAVNTQQNTADDRPTRGVCWHNRLSGYNSPMTPR